MLNNLECLVYVVQIGLLVQQSAQVFDLDPQQQLFLNAVELVLYKLVQTVEVAIRNFLT